jgi:hypothetical protein
VIFNGPSSHRPHRSYRRLCIAHAAASARRHIESRSCIAHGHRRVIAYHVGRRESGSPTSANLVCWSPVLAVIFRACSALFPRPPRRRDADPSKSSQGDAFVYAVRPALSDSKAVRVRRVSTFVWADHSTAGVAVPASWLLEHHGCCIHWPLSHPHLQHEVALWEYDDIHT